MQLKPVKKRTQEKVIAKGYKKSSILIWVLVLKTTKAQAANLPLTNARAAYNRKWVFGETHLKILHHLLKWCLAVRLPTGRVKARY